MATWTNNFGGAEIDVNVSVELDDDDSPYLSFAATWVDGVDLLITDDFEAQTFFDEVARAKSEWDKTKATA